jgi:hypothetical protein
MRCPVGESCQVFELGTFGLEVASALSETCFDLGWDIRGLIRCTGDVCYDTPELAQIFRNGPRRVKIVLLEEVIMSSRKHVGNEHTDRAAWEPLLFPRMKAAER